MTRSDRSFPVGPRLLALCVAIAALLLCVPGAGAAPSAGDVQNAHQKLSRSPTARPGDPSPDQCDPGAARRGGPAGRAAGERAGADPGADRRDQAADRRRTGSLRADPRAAERARGAGVHVRCGDRASSSCSAPRRYRTCRIAWSSSTLSRRPTRGSPRRWRTSKWSSRSRRTISRSSRRIRNRRLPRRRQRATASCRSCSSRTPSATKRNGTCRTRSATGRTWRASGSSTCGSSRSRRRASPEHPDPSRPSYQRDTTTRWRSVRSSPSTFGDGFGAPRYAGGFHLHAGVDVLADYYTPIHAPFDGVAKKSYNTLGGNSEYVYGAQGYVYNAHLSRYSDNSTGPVKAGEIIGFVGDTGDAIGTPHDHFEWHPNTILPQLAGELVRVRGDRNRCEPVPAAVRRLPLITLPRRATSPGTGCRSSRSSLRRRSMRRPQVCRSRRSDPY